MDTVVDTVVSTITSIREQDAIGAHTWASWYHAYVKIFLCQTRVSVAVLLIVKGWLKWVKKET